MELTCDVCNKWIDTKYTNVYHCEDAYNKGTHDSRGMDVYICHTCFEKQEQMGVSLAGERKTFEKTYKEMYGKAIRDWRGHPTSCPICTGKLTKLTSKNMKEILGMVINYATYMVKMGFNFPATKSIWDTKAPGFVKFIITFVTAWLDISLAVLGLMIILLPVFIVIMIMKSLGYSPE